MWNPGKKRSYLTPKKTKGSGGGIWDEVKEHNKQAEWLKEIKGNATYPSKDDLQITKEKVEMQRRKVPNWKAPGLDGVQSFWIKYLSPKNSASDGKNLK